MLKLITSLLILAVLFAGCATVPNVKLSYYRTQWSAKAKVTQTVMCNTEKTHLFVLSTPTVETSYTSDYSAPPFHINIKDLDGGVFAHSDFAMTFTNDGRLKSVNQSTTGQGEAIIKSVVSLVGALISIPGLTGFGLHGETIVEEIPVCDDIQRWGSGKPVSLVYTKNITKSELGQQRIVFDKAAPEDLFDDLKHGLPELFVDVSNIEESVSGPSYEPLSSAESENMVKLELQKVGAVELSFFIRKKAEPETTTLGNEGIIVPMSETYYLPIPKAALFGKQSFNVTLSEAGAVTTVGYGKETGAEGVLNALGAAAATQTAEAKAARVKAQADLIFQQERLLLCQKDPKECPK